MSHTSQRVTLCPVTNSTYTNTHAHAHTDTHTDTQNMAVAYLVAGTNLLVLALALLQGPALCLQTLCQVGTLQTLQRVLLGHRVQLTLGRGQLLAYTNIHTYT